MPIQSKAMMKNCPVYVSLYWNNLLPSSTADACILGYSVLKWLWRFLMHKHALIMYSSY